MNIVSFVVSEEDVAFEYELQGNGRDFRSWERYLEHKKETQNADSIAWVFERFCQNFGNNEKLWIEYVKWRLGFLDNHNSVLFDEEFVKCDRVFEKALHNCPASAPIWILFMEHCIKQRNLGKIRTVLNAALRCVPFEKHLDIWEVVVSFTERLLADTAVSALDVEELDLLVRWHANGVHPDVEIPDLWSSHILRRFVQVTDDIERALFLLGMTNDEITIADVFQQHIFKKTFSPVSHSPFEFYRRYLTALDRAKRDREFLKILDSCLEKFPDQWCFLMKQLAHFHLVRGKLQDAISCLKKAMLSTLKVKNYAEIYNFLTQILEGEVEALLERVQEQPDGEASYGADLKDAIDALENLIENNGISLNDLRLRQNINDVEAWQARVGLFSNVADKCKVYTEAITKINPTKVSSPGTFGKLWCDFAQIYVDARDLDTARETLDHAVRVPFPSLPDLEHIWLFWTKTELKCSGCERAINLLSKALTVPGSTEELMDVYEKGNGKIPAQTILFSSRKLWYYFIDLLEAFWPDTVSDRKVKDAYEQTIDLKIASPSTFLHFASFLQKANLWSESYQLYERAIEVFPAETRYEIWNIYLGKIVSQNVSLERIRELCESALQLVHEGVNCESLFILYADVEEQNGFYHRSIDLLCQGCRVIESVSSKCTLWQICLSKCSQLLGDESSRSLYEECVMSLPNSRAVPFVLDFIRCEIRLRDFERARAILAFGGKLVSVSKNLELWTFWNDFELRYGNRDSYKEMLTLRREVEGNFKVDTAEISKNEGNVEFVASKAIVGSDGKKVSSVQANPEEIELEI
ncbi:LAMI_0D11342g1_1 [Lachancea mirantina]|uniref:Pre-mRNA-splicing factor SYF1 n=1 Tax=Lachancea mirantina TaxID=1230905 RepID=A0A1G4JF90_9SACH|nr:LAMI_0D11342g1_1 [Lachancea mirantina]